MSTSRRTIIAGAVGLASLPAVGQRRPEFYPIPVELVVGLERLPGRINLGNRAGDAHLVEFFDYNCGFCRRTARDIRPMLTADRNLKVTLVNFAVLGIPSIGATRVALAFSRQRADRYLDFHEQLFAVRGAHGPDEAVAIAVKLGANQKRLVEDADSDAITEAMKASLGLGDAFGFAATPSFLVGREGFSGALDLRQKQAAIAAFRKCEKASCT